jgi:hypothetical protein
LHGILIRSGHLRDYKAKIPAQFQFGDHRVADGPAVCVLASTGSEGEYH